MIQTRKQVLQNRNYNRSECTELKTAIYTAVTLSGLVLFLGFFFNPQFADKFPFVKIDKRKLHGAKKAAQEFRFNSKFSTLLRLHIVVLLHKS